MIRSEPRGAEPYFALFTHSADGVLLTAPDGRILTANPAACRLFGTSADELAHVGWPSLFERTDGSFAPHERAGPWAPGASRDLPEGREVLCRRRDGTTFLAEITATSFRDSLGELRTAMTIRDVSERVRLAQERERYFKFFMLSADAMCIAGVNNTFQHVNGAFVALTGYSADELVARPFLDFVHPADRERTALEMALIPERATLDFENRYVRKDGAIILLSWTAYFDRKDGGTYAVARDVTAARASDAKLQRLHALYETLIHCNSALIHSTSEETLFRAVCQAAVRSGFLRMAWIGLVEAGSDAIRPVAAAGEGLDYLDALHVTARDEPHGRGPTGCAVREGRPFWCQDYFQSTATAPWHDAAKRYGWGSAAALPIVRMGNTIGAFTLYANEVDVFSEDVQRLLMAMADDLHFALDHLARADREARARAALAVAEARWRFALDSGAHGIWEWEPVSNRVFYSSGWKTMLGYDEGEIRDTLAEWETRVHPDDLARTLAKIERHLAGETAGYESEHRVRCKDGSYAWILDRGRVVRRDPTGRPLLVMGTHTDVTARKRGEDALRKSEARLRAIFEEAPLGIAVIDSLDGRFIEANPVFAAISGHSLETLYQTDWMSITHPADVAEDLQLMAHMNAGRTQGFRLKKRYVRADGSDVRIHMTVASIKAGHEDGRPRHLCMIEDITESERALAALEDREQQFRALAEQSLMGVYMSDGVRITYVNPHGAAIFGYSPEAMVALPVVALIAPEDRALVAENMRRRIAGEVESLRYEFRGLRQDGSEVLIGVHGNAAFLAGKRVIVGVLQDVTEKKLAEDQIALYLAQLQAAFMRTVEVAMNLSELRDPYTVGHEKRVADIAVAIGRELGFDADRLEGLRVAGYLHDIGKITIPAEILSKPGRLTPPEFELVKTHARAGYDVLKDVGFPWPVAEVVLQHHERIDGSGYPQALVGDAIRLEARVMAVADVVEAMASHRPYRVGLGLEAALAEIARGQGAIYDPVVAAACLRLFRERGFRLGD